MGRGRQKAKQTKVARKLKYYSPDTDYSALQRELSKPSNDAEDETLDDDIDDEADDGDYDDADDSDEYANWSPGRGH